MGLRGEYEPSPSTWVADQVRDFEASAGTEHNTLRGVPIVVLTTRGRRSGKLRKAALMRVEHEGSYVVVASMGGAPTHPVWYLNLLDDPEVTLQDGDRVIDARARTASPEERAEWWPRATAVWPDYDDYQARTEREIPVVIVEPTT